MVSYIQSITFEYLWGLLLTTKTSDWIFAVSVFVFAILSFLFLKRLLLGRSLELTHFTLPSFFIIIYIFLMSLPSIIWFCSLTYPIRYSYFFAIQSVPILFLLGVMAANAVFRHPSSIVRGFLSSSLTKTRQDSCVFPFYLVTVLSSIVIVTVYISVADYVPLIGSFTRYGEMEGQIVRHSIYKVPEIIQYAYALTVRFFLPFCVLYAYLMAYVCKGRWRYSFLIMFCLALFSSMMSLERSNTLGLFILLILAHYSIKNVLIAKKQATILVVALIVGGLMHRAQYQLDINLKNIMGYMVGFFISRIWLDPSYMTFVAFNEYNYATTFLYGKSIRVLSLFGVEHVHFSSVGFVGDLWANFGPLGVIIGTIIIGFILQFIQLRFFKKKSILTLMIYIMLLLNGAWLMYGSVLSTMVVSVYLLSILLLLVFLPIIEGAVGVERSIVPMVSHPNTSKEDQ